MTYPLEITVEIEGDVDTSMCSGCTDPISVYYYPSNGPIAMGEQLKADNYVLIGVASFGSMSTWKSLNFSLGSEYDRFYIAIVAENTCFTLEKLLVSYKVCDTDPVGLVIYPDTPVGSRAVNTSASCVANADVSPGSSLNITCSTDGTYAGSPSCSCEDGYVQVGANCGRSGYVFLSQVNINSYTCVPT